MIPTPVYFILPSPATGISCCVLPDHSETSFFVGNLLVVFGIILYRMVQYVSAVHGHDEA